VTAVGTLTVRAGLREGLATAPLRWLEAAWLASSVAGWAFMVVLAVYAYDQGGAAAVGLAALARMVPAGLAAPFAGLLADRHPRRAVLVAVGVGRAVALAGVAVLAAAGAGLAPVLALATVATALATAEKPAQAALLPLLATTPRQLAATNSLWSATSNGGFLLGALGGGLVTAAAGAPAAFGAAAAAYAVGTAALYGVPPDAVPEHRTATEGGPARELLLGAREIARVPALRRLVALLTVMALLEGAVDILVVVVALELLATGDAGVGWLNACWGLGGVAGGAVALGLLGRGRLAAGLGLGALLVAAGLLAVGALPSVAVAVPALVALGIGYALVEVAGLTLLQRLAGDAVLARAFAVVESSYWLATGAGAILAPGLVALVGVRGALAAVASLVLAVAASWRTLGRLEAGAAVPEREFRLLRDVPLFAPVPLATLETLAGRLVPVTLAPGEPVIREGDVGDRFYVVAEGRLAISRDGVEQATAGPGDFFGETALLQACPRTASVTAQGPGLAFALDRDAFLDTVTTHARAQLAADRIIEERTRA
jgi:MFS family permease